jgi:hypothetical protein
MKLAAYFISKKLVSHYDFRVSHQRVLTEELALACLLGRRPNWCERQMSMHGGTRSGFVSAGSSAFVLECYTEPFPACCVKEVKTIICLTFEYMTAWLYRKLSCIERFPYII